MCYFLFFRNSWANFRVSLFLQNKSAIFKYFPEVGKIKIYGSLGGPGVQKRSSIFAPRLRIFENLATNNKTPRLPLSNSTAILILILILCISVSVLYLYTINIMASCLVPIQLHRRLLVRTVRAVCLSTRTKLRTQTRRSGWKQQGADSTSLFNVQSLAFFKIGLGSLLIILRCFNRLSALALLSKFNPLQPIFRITAHGE